MLSANPRIDPYEVTLATPQILLSQVYKETLYR